MIEPNIHVISHTHWDREWYKTYQHFRLQLVHLIDRLLYLLDEDPDFKYFMLDGQTIVLEDYLQMRPQQADALRAHIQCGRILIGPWYILPDEFLVSPEATIRNLLVGKELCEQFGQRMMIGYIPDPFGHIGQMPQILKGFKIDTACFWRGLDDQPCELWWQAPDGSKVFTLYLRDSYSNGAGLAAENPAQFANDLSRASQSIIQHSATAAGHAQAVIMYGTDHMEPPANSAGALAFARQQLPDVTINHSTLAHAMQAVQDEIVRLNVDLPTVTGELRACKRMPLLPGVLSTRMWIKMRNQECETLLERWAEPFSTWATHLTGLSPLSSSTLTNPAQIIQQAWKLLIECHPHDSICGCSIDQVHDEMRPRFDQVEQIGEEITRQSLEIISSQINSTPPADLKAISALTVFNPVQYTLCGPVTASISLPSSVTAIKIVDEGGNILPHQQSGMGNRVLFSAELDHKGLAESASMIHEGHVAGLVVREIQTRREGETVFIDLVLMENGDPDLQAWKCGQQMLNDLLQDSSITRFIACARTLQAFEINFTARDVPGLGYRTFWICDESEPEAAPKTIRPVIKWLMPTVMKLGNHPVIQRWIGKAISPKAEHESSIQNEYLRVDLNRQDGTLTMTDLRTGISLCGLNRFEDGGDCGDEYNYAPPDEDMMTASRLVSWRSEKSANSQTLVITLQMDVAAGLNADRKARCSNTLAMQVTSRVTLHHAIARVDIETTVDNQARDHRLRVHFPADIKTESADFDGHFEVIRRSLCRPEGGPDWVEAPRPECPQRAFTTITDGRSGLTLTNRGLPEIEVMKTKSGTEMALTLLRCVGWLSRDDFSTRKGHAGPMMETPGAQEIGRHVFHYALIPHAEGWSQAEPLARNFEAAMRAVPMSIQNGPLPPASQMLHVNGAFQVTCIKTAQGCDDIILRGWAPREGEINIQTRLPVRSASRAWLDEMESTPLNPADLSGWRLQARRGEIITLRLK